MDTMPFGKHKGKPIVELDTAYMTWLLENTEIRDPLKTAVQTELDKRTVGTSAHGKKPPPPPPDEPSDEPERRLRYLPEVKRELAAALREVAAKLEGGS